MVKKCVICGKDAKQYVTNAEYPTKYICLNCLNGIAFSSKDIDLKPVEAALSKAFGAFKDQLGK